MKVWNISDGVVVFKKIAIQPGQSIVLPGSPTPRDLLVSKLHFGEGVPPAFKKKQLVEKLQKEAAEKTRAYNLKLDAAKGEVAKKHLVPVELMKVEVKESVELKDSATVKLKKKE